MVNWKSIESAPKDGTKVLCCNANGEIRVCHWATVEMSGREGWQVSVVSTDRNYYTELAEPTHWAPLPPDTR